MKSYLKQETTESFLRCSDSLAARETFSLPKGKYGSNCELFKDLRSEMEIIINIMGTHCV